MPDNTGTTTIGTPTTIVTTVVGENAIRSFAASAGQKLTLTVSANSYSEGAFFTIRQPNGSSVTAPFFSTPTGFLDTFAVPVTGTYTIEVDPRAQQTGTATYLLATVPDNTGTTTIGTPTTVVTTVVGENAIRSFPATAGQRVTLSVSANSYSDGAFFTIRQPNGASVTSPFFSAPSGTTQPIALPATGTYTIEVDPRAQQTGTATFLLADAPAALAAPSVVGRATTALDPAESAFITRTLRPTAAAAATDSTPSAATAAAAVVPSLTITVAELLANDRPGPDNESDQTLTVTAVAAGPFTHGTVSFVAGVVTYTPDADFIGTAGIPYTICDDGTTNGQPDPRCSTGSIEVRVTANHPPVVDPQTLTTAEDTPLTLTLTGTDADGEPITFVTAAPGHGALTGTPPVLTYTPAPDANGGDAFRFTANDGKDQSVAATVAITVTPVNDAPVPNPDTVTARAGEPVDIPTATLTGNDDAGPFDERAEHLTVTAVASGAETHGTVALAGATVTFTPEPGFTGTAVVGYTVCDDGTTNGAADPRCADSTLSIGANRTPTAADQSVQTSLTKPLPIVLVANDPDGDVVTYAVVTPPAHGTLAGTAPNLTYTAATGFVGTDHFTFSAADAYGTSAPATVTIVVDDIPSPTLGADTATVRAAASVLVDVLANDTAGSGTLQPSTLAVTAAPATGTATVEAGKIRYRAAAGVSGADTFTYTVCDSGGGCASAAVTVTITDNTVPTATDDAYDVAAGVVLRPTAPGVLGNDTDPDVGDTIQARLGRGVTNGRLLLNANGSFSYTPNGPGIDSFTYHVVDAAGATSPDATVTIYVTGPAGPPVVGNDRYEVEQGRELTIAGPGVLANDDSPNPRLALHVALRRDVANGALLLRDDGSFTYTPAPGFTGIDQFSYVVRDAEGRSSGEAHVGITVTAGGPSTATIGAISPAAGATLFGPTHITLTLVPPAGETVTAWTVSYRRPGSAVLVQLASGVGTAVAADFDPTLVRNGTYAIVARAVTSNGGVMVAEHAVSVEGDYKPGRYATTVQDVAVNSANVPIDLYRTYDSIDRAGGELGAGWRFELADFRIDSNGPLGGGGWSRYTCGSFPFLAACYQTSKPHFVTVTWPDGHVERFRFQPNQGSSLLPTITTAGFVAEPGTTSTLEPTEDGLLMSGQDFLLGDFFSADGIYDPIQFVLTDRTGTKYLVDRRAGLLAITDRNGNQVTLGRGGLDATSGMAMTFGRDADDRITSVEAPGGTIDYTYSAAGDLTRVDYPNGTAQTYTYDADHNLLTVGGDGRVLRTLHYDSSGRITSVTDGNGNTSTLDNDVAGHQSVITDASGQLTTVVTYDDRGDAIRIDRTTGGRTITTGATYDGLGRQLSSTDGLGHTSSQTYDAAGNVTTRTDANGKTTTNTYNALGQLLTTTDPLGHTTTNTYDGRGNLTATTDGTGTTSSTYNADGDLLTTTDALNRTTTRVYDTNGQVVGITDPGGHTTHLTIDDGTGRVTAATDPTGATTTYGYDGKGNLTSITDGNGHTRSATYDRRTTSRRCRTRAARPCAWCTTRPATSRPSRTATARPPRTATTPGRACCPRTSPARARPRSPTTRSAASSAPSTPSPGWPSPTTPPTTCSPRPARRWSPTRCRRRRSRTPTTPPGTSRRCRPPADRRATATTPAQC